MNQQQPPAQQFQQDQQQHPKNPNGGYLKPSDYGADQFFGSLTITGAMLQQLLAQSNGGDVKISIKVNELRNGQYGAYRRITANPMTPDQQARVNQVQAAPQAPPVQQPSVQPQVFAPGSVMATNTTPAAPATAPTQQAPVQQPPSVQTQAKIIEDEIPF